MDKMREEFEAWCENEPDRTTATKCASLRQLITRLREAEKDVERMSWIESNGFSIEMADYNHISCNRAAIDQAMKEKDDE